MQISRQDSGRWVVKLHRGQHNVAERGRLPGESSRARPQLSSPSIKPISFPQNGKEQSGRSRSKFVGYGGTRKNEFWPKFKLDASWNAYGSTTVQLQTNPSNGLPIQRHSNGKESEKADHRSRSTSLAIESNPRPFQKAAVIYEDKNEGNESNNHTRAVFKKRTKSASIQFKRVNPCAVRPRRRWQVEPKFPFKTEPKAKAGRYLAEWIYPKDNEGAAEWQQERIGRDIHEPALVRASQREREPRKRQPCPRQFCVGRPESGLLGRRDSAEWTKSARFAATEFEQHEH